MDKILIVDDEVNVTKSLQRLLITEPWDVTTCNDPNEALAILKQEKFAVILSDFRMPGLNGVEFLSLTKNIQNDAIRMIMSGVADTDTVISAVNEAEIFRFINKPWNCSELTHAIAQGIKLRDILVENKQFADILRKQQQVIDYQNEALTRLEEDSPGITKVNWDEEGRIIIDEDEL